VLFVDRLPDKKALDAFRNLIACSVGRGKLKTNYTLLGHRQARDTLCPGETLFKEISTWPHWVANPSPRMYTANYAASGADKISWISAFTLIGLGFFGLGF